MIGDANDLSPATYTNTFYLDDSGRKTKMVCQMDPGNYQTYSRYRKRGFRTRMTDPAWAR